MNEIISRYAPGREISASGSVNVGDVKAINDSLSEMSATISKICDSITNVVSDVLWAALGIFLFGLFSVAYYVIKGAINLFRSDEDKRKDKADKIFDKKIEVTVEVESKLKVELSANTAFKNAVTSSLNNYFNKLIENNLQQVIIPIE